MSRFARAADKPGRDLDSHADGVSVVIPVYNRASTIGRAIASAQRQTCPPLEILVVDDCSTDDTRDVVAALAAQDQRIKLLCEPRNGGGSVARNTGLRAANASIVAFLDSDDEWLDRHLERRITTLRGEPRPALVFGSFYIADARSRAPLMCAPFEGDPLEYVFAGLGGFRTSTFAGTRDALRDVTFDERLRKHQDWDLVFNLVQRQFRVVADPEPTSILHTASDDRLSAKVDHEASTLFYLKNGDRGSRTGWALFCAIMLERAFRTARQGADFRYYLDTLKNIDSRAGAIVGILTHLLYVPRLGRRLFRTACTAYCLATADARERAATRRSH